MSFLADRKSGEKGETLFQNILNKFDIKNSKNESKIKTEMMIYDVIAWFPQEIKFEVKMDLYCARSGNIAIEFYNPKQGKPSGIDATKADFWVHNITCPTSCWITSVATLKNYVNNTTPLRTISCGGDKNSSMYLYKKDLIFNDIFHRVDECDKEQFLGIINKLLM